MAHVSFAAKYTGVCYSSPAKPWPQQAFTPIRTKRRTGANISRLRYRRVIALVALITIITIASTQLKADTGTCGGQMITLPLTDVPSSNVFFCSIVEAYFSALTNGTTAATYSPTQNVPRDQMSAFVTRTLDQSLKRGSRRAALKQY